MDIHTFIRHSLHLNGMPVKEADLPYIQHVYHTIQQAQLPLKAQPDLSEEMPMTIVDPELIRHD
ncbi:MAG: hypothetical protein LPK26_16805 [Bacillaceae bacterium]|nr:hypothetical protein [Bacillaceae bacterium]